MALFGMAEWSSTVSVSIFIQQSVDGHSGGFHVLAIVSSAAVNMGGCVS